MSKARVKQLEEQLAVLKQNFSSVLEELNARTAELAAAKRDTSDAPAQIQVPCDEDVVQREKQLSALTARHEQESKEIAELITQLGVQWERKKQQLALRHIDDGAHPAPPSPRTDSSEPAAMRQELSDTRAELQKQKQAFADLQARGTPIGLLGHLLRRWAPRPRGPGTAPRHRSPPASPPSVRRRGTARSRRRTRRLSPRPSRRAPL